MPGSLSVRGKVLPISGVTAKIEAAVKSGVKTVIIPRVNMQDVLLDERFEGNVEVIAVDTFDEIMEHVLITHDKKQSLVD